MNTNWPAWRRERRRFDAAACGGGRQLDAEHTAASELAVDRYGAAMRGDDPLADGETKTRPGIDRLGGEEGVENMWQGVLPNAAPGVVIGAREHL